MNTYIAIKDNIIIRVYRSGSLDSVKQALKNICASYDNIKEIPADKTYPETDEKGYYLRSIKPYNGMQYIPETPEIVEGFIPRHNGAGWEQITDIRGTYYHTDTQEQIIINTYDTEVDLTLYTKLIPEQFSKWVSEAWIFDYETYGKIISTQLRSKCREEREKYFPDTVKDNLLVGQTYSNKLLTIENYNKLVTFYRSMVSVFEPEIMRLTTKKEIDDLYESIEWPTEEKIMELINA